MSGPAFAPEQEQYLTALVALIGATGSTSFQLRYDDEEEPTVWNAVASYPSRGAVPNVGGAGKAVRQRHRAETAGALDPLLAAYRLAMLLIDGGQCTTCRSTTMLCESRSGGGLPPDPEFCWRVYDGEGGFTRTCDGRLVTERRGA